MAHPSTNDVRKNICPDYVRAVSTASVNTKESGRYMVNAGIDTDTGEYLSPILTNPSFMEWTKRAQTYPDIIPVSVMIINRATKKIRFYSRVLPLKHMALGEVEDQLTSPVDKPEALELVMMDPIGLLAHLNGAWLTSVYLRARKSPTGKNSSFCWTNTRIVRIQVKRKPVLWETTCGTVAL